MLTERVPEGGKPRIAIYGVTAQSLPERLAALPPAAAAYARTCGFKGEEGQVLLAPGPDGAIAAVLFGIAGTDAPDADLMQPGKLATVLPPGEYRLADGFERPDLAALAFELGRYRFTAFKPVKPDAQIADLELPEGVDAARLKRIVDAVWLGRDLINRPANDLGPEALEAACLQVAQRHGAACECTVGEALIARNFPLVHAVGRAGAQAPRLVDIRWQPDGAVGDLPAVTLVGKGVCFDTGGLDIKPGSGMLLMKKDMGGAATALAIADMVMGAKLPVRLRLLVPIVENAIAGNAFRPGDILASRKGLTVEIGNTDAEGRLILADALALADEEAPDLLLDFATLTGAARVALGPDLPPFYTDSDGFAQAVLQHAAAVADPCWRMPLWGPYAAMLKSKVADLNNVSSGSFAGSVTAALFLKRFVEKAKTWAHFDIYGWTPTAKPGRPEGGEVQMARAVFDLLNARYPRDA